jgi:hypothetical protein
MPRFKTNTNVFDDLNEYFIEDWFKSSELQLPETNIWNRMSVSSISVTDVELWEVLFEATTNEGFLGVYAAWNPYDDFTIVVQNKKITAQYSGKDSVEKANTFLQEANLPSVCRYNGAVPVYSSVRM